MENESTEATDTQTVTIRMNRALLDEIQGRARRARRSRTAEIELLLELALEVARDRETKVERALRA